MGAGHCSSGRLSGGTGGTKLLEGEGQGVFKLESSRVSSGTGGTILLKRESWRVGAGHCSSGRLSGGTGGTKLLEGERCGVFKLESSRVSSGTGWTIPVK